MKKLLQSSLLILAAIWTYGQAPAPTNVYTNYTGWTGTSLTLTGQGPNNITVTGNVSGNIVNTYTTIGGYGVSNPQYKIVQMTNGSSSATVTFSFSQPVQDLILPALFWDFASSGTHTIGSYTDPSGAVKDLSPALHAAGTDFTDHTVNNNSITYNYTDDTNGKSASSLATALIWTADGPVSSLTLTFNNVGSRIDGISPSFNIYPMSWVPASGGVQPANNVDLADNLCEGINVAFVLDRSGSMDNTEIGLVREGVRKGLLQLNGAAATNEAMFIDFGKFNIGVKLAMTPITSASVVAGGAHYDYLFNSYVRTAESTNWEDALQVVLNQINAGVDIDMIVLVSDGFPNNISSTDTEGLASYHLDNLIPLANQIKNAGTHIVLFGTGGITDNSGQEIASFITDKNPLKYSTGADVREVDYAIAKTFDEFPPLFDNFFNDCVTQGNDPPIAVDDLYTTPVNTTLTVNAANGALPNDSDPEGEVLTITTIPISGPSNGTITLNADGSFTYTPNNGFVGTDVITYEVCDPQGGCAQADIIITIEDVLPPPATCNNTDYTYDANLDVNSSGQYIPTSARLQCPTVTEISGTLPTIFHSGSVNGTAVIEVPEYVTTDGFLGRASDNQPNETWKIEFYKGGVKVGETNSTTDVPDGDDYAFATGSLNAVPIPNGADSYKIVHTGCGLTGGTNSVYPSSFCLDLKVVDLQFLKTGWLNDDNANDCLDVGETITYTFKIKNTGTEVLNDVLITDDKLGLSNFACGAGLLQPGSVRTCTFDYTVTQADIDAGSIENQASVSAVATGGVTVTDLSSDSESVPDNPTVNNTCPAVPDITVDKLAELKDPNNNGLPEVGETISYTFTITNTGNVTLTNVVLTDVLQGLTLSGGPISSMAPGASDTGTYSGTYTLTQADIDAGFVENTATVTGTSPSGSNVTDDDKETVTLNRQKAIRLIKTGSITDANGNGCADAGDTITYTFEVTNTGNVTLNNITIDDSKLGLVDFSCGSGSLAPGASRSCTSTYTITQADVDSGNVTNSATVEATAPDSSTVSDDSSDSTTTATNPTVIPTCSDASVQLIKTGSLTDNNGNGCADAGDTITYTFEVTNTGNVTLNNITIDDSKLGLVDFSCGSGSLAPGASRSCTSTYTIPQADVDSGNVTNSATVEATAPDSSTVSDDSSDSTTTATNPTVIPTCSDASVQLIKTGSLTDNNGNGCADAGDTITYTFEVTNTGNVTLNNITIDDSKLGLVDFSCGSGSLAPGASRSCTSTYTITQADVDSGNVTNSATVEATAPDSSTVSDDSSDSTTTATNPTVIPTCSDASVQLIKTGSLTDNNGNGCADAGDTITYTFEVTNTGNVTLNNITIDDSKLGLVDFSCGSGSLAPGASRSCTSTYTITQADVDSGNVTNSATVEATAPDSSTVSDDSSDSTTTATNPTVIPTCSDASVQLIKTGSLTDNNGNGCADAGDTITYTFEVTNTGNVTLNNITIDDSKLGLVDFSCGSGSLAPGASRSCTSTYTITQADVDSGNVTNSATVEATAPDSSTVSDDSSDSTTTATNPTVIPTCSDASVQLIKTGSLTDNNGNGCADAGDTITYTFEVTNTGNVTLNNITIDDSKLGLVDFSCGSGSLAPGASRSCTSTYTITQADVDSGNVTNSATAEATAPDSSTVSDDSSDSTTTATNPTVIPTCSDASVQLIKTGSLTDNNGNGCADAGDTITYTFEVTNTGNVTLNNITIDDSKLGLVDFSCGSGSLAPGASRSCTSTYTITQADVDSGNVTNSATVEATAPDSSTVSDDSSDSTTTATNPTVIPTCSDASIELIKTGVWSDSNGNSSADVGETITYSFTVTNTGNVTISNITLSDAKITVSGGPITLAPGASNSTSFTGTYTITQADIDAGNVTNTATATGQDPSGNDVTDDSSSDPNLPNEPTVTTLPQDGSLELIKTGVWSDSNGNSSADVGETITYSFTVTNTGNVTISNITLSDAKITVSGGPITLAPGASNSTSFTGTYTITQADIDAGNVTNTATATGQDPSGNDVTDDSSSDPNLPNEPTVTTLPQDGSLELIKTGVWSDSNGNSSADVGETITYSFTVTNTGNVTISNITLSDAKITVSGGPITLAPGASNSTSFTGTYTITQADIDAGNVTNTATATGQDPSGNDVTDDSSSDPNLPNEPTVTTLPQDGSLELIKAGVWSDSNGNSSADVGETITYSFTVTNTGNVTISNITLSDAKITVSGGPITLAPGASNSTSFTGTYTITQADIDAGNVTNTATATGQDPSGNDVTDDSSSDPNLPNEPTVTTLPQDGSLELIKTGVWSDSNGNSSADVGETITYSFTVTNTGNVTISNITLSDAKITVSGGPITLAPGASNSTSFTGTYTITQADIDAGNVTNTATATGQDPSGNDVTDDSSSDPNLPNEPTVTTLPQDGSLELIKTGVWSDSNGNSSADVGETITYSFTVTNTGNVTISNITLSDAKITVSGGPITLAPGASNSTSFTGTYTITQADIDAGNVTNTATATGQDPSGNDVTDDSSSDPNLPNEPTVTTLPQDGSLELIKTGVWDDSNGNSSADVGETITYSFTVTNTGNVTISNITLSDAKITVSGGPITLAPGASNSTSFTGTYTITQADIDAGNVTNTATATGQDPSGNDVTDDSSSDPNLPNEPTVTTLPQDGSLELIKTGVWSDSNGNSSADVGETITYSFTVTNTGNVTISNITLSDAKITVSGGPITLAPGASNSTSFTGTYTITQADIDAGNVTNTATATGQDPSGNDVTDDSSSDPNLPNEPTVTTLPQDGSLELIKTGVWDDSNGNSSADVGETITYSFTVTNTGNVTISNITLSDAKITVSGGPITLAPGASNSTSFTGTYTITQADIDAGNVTNTATATGQDPSGNDVTDDSSSDPNLPNEPTVTTLPQDGSLELIKTGVWSDSNGNSSADVGETITYSFTVTNTGNVTISNITLSDAKITVSGGPITLAPGASNSTSFTGTYTITQADIDAGNVTNTATATGQDPSGNDVTDDSSSDPNLPNEPTVTTLPQDGSLELIKTGVWDDSNGNSSADVGETITYSFTVTNTGNVTISNITLSDAKITVSGGPITLAPGASNSTSFTGTYTITQADIDAGNVTNTATATGQDPSGNNVTDDSSSDPNLPNEPTVTTLPQDGSLELIKTGVWDDSNGNSSADVGETITYSFTVTNTGNVTISNITLSDAKITVSGGPITLAPGASNSTSFTGTYTITQADIDAGNVTNTATATGQDPSGNDVTDDSSSDPNLPNEPTVTTLPQDGSLELIKAGVWSDSNGNSSADVGETITYSFTVTNTGNVTISNITLSDAKITVSGGPITLAPGASNSTSFTGTYTITQADIDAGNVTNTATATGQDPSGNDVTDDSSSDPNLPNEPTVTTLPQDGSLELIKTGVWDDSNGDGAANAGETITYTFAITNTGNVTITNIEIDDATLGITDLACVSSLAPGESGSCTATYTVTQADINAGNVTNTATATGTDPSGNDVNDDSSSDPNLPGEPTVTTLPGDPGLELIKTGTFNDESGDGFAQVGETITYTFKVTNTGNVPVTNITVTDPKVTVSGGPIDLAVGTMDNTTFSGTYTITQADIDAGQVENTATATGQDPDGTDVTDDSSSDPNVPEQPTVTPLPQASGITVDKLGLWDDANNNLVADAGETINYTFTVTNTGNTSLTVVTVTDLLAGVTVSGGPITLAPGEVNTTAFTATYTLTQADIDAGIVTNTAKVTAENPDGGEESDTDVENTQLPQDGEIALIKTGVWDDSNGDGAANAGETITYTFAITNTGNVTITNIEIDDATLGITDLACVSSLAPGESGSCTATYTVTQADINAGNVTNTATATGTDPSGNDVNDDSSSDPNLPGEPTVTTLPGDPGLELIKTGTFNDESGDGFAQVGETITYTFKVTNTGNVPVTNITVTDPKVTVSGGPIDLAVGTMDNTTFSGTYTITQADIDAGQVENTATATGQDPDGTDVTDDSSSDPNVPEQPTVTPLPQASGITVDKLGLWDDANNNLVADAGETINYTFTVTNTGNTSLTVVTVTDLLAGVTVSGGPITLAPGEVNTTAFTATYTLTQADIDAGIVTNTAKVTAENPDGGEESDTDVENTQLPQDGEIALIKTGVWDDSNGDGAANAGETITYTFAITNTGNVTITNIEIDDATLGITDLACVSSLAPGESGSCTATYTVTQADINAGNVTNTATATGTDPSGNDVNDDSSSDPNLPGEPTVTTLPGDPGLELIKTGTFNDESGDGFAQVGETITYTFKVTNTGNVPVTNITVTDPKVTVSGGPIDLAVGTMDNTTFSGTYTITQADIDAGQVENTATATGQDPDGTDVTDDSSSDPNVPEQPTVTPLPQASGITVDKLGLWDDANNNLVADAGETINYTFTVTNTGNTSLTVVTVTDLLAGVTVSGGPITLAPGEVNTTAFTATYTLTQADIDAGIVTNTAKVTAENPDGGEESDTDVENTQLPQDGEIALIKTGVWDDSNGDGAANAGETITYTFAITNTGNVTITNIEIDDATLGITDLACVSSLAPGESGSCTATYTVTQADINAGNVTNTATATGTDPSGNDVNDDSSSDPNLPGEPTVTTLPGDPGLELIKTGTFNDESGDGFAQVGETITYTFKVTNTGNVPVTNITVTDPKVTVSGGPIDLAVGTMDNTTFSGTYTITQADIDAGQVENTATATGQDPDGTDVTDDSSSDPNVPEQPTVTPLPQASGITVDKLGLWDDANNNLVADAGETINYTFTVTNTGNTSLTVVTVTDLLAGVTVSGGPITLAPGEVNTTAFTATYTLTQADIDAGIVTNTAKVTAENPDGGEESDTDVENTQLPQDGEIALIKTGVWDDSNGDGAANAGETITYTFAITNTGNVTITNIEIDDATLGITDLACVSSLAPGESGSCTATYTVTQADINAGNVTNTATATGTDPSGNDVNDDSSSDPNLPGEPTVTTLPGDPGLELIKTGTFNDESGDGFAQVGETITYTFKVTNTGNVPVTNITVTDPKVTVSGGPIDLAVGTMDNTTFSGTYTITQADIDAGQVENTATATGQDPDGTDVTDDSSSDPNVPEQPTVTPLPQASGITVDKLGLWDDANNNLVADAGETINYTFTVTNTGNTSLTVVTVTDLLAGVTVSGGPITLAPGEVNTTAFTATYTLTQADIDAGIVTNTAKVTAENPDGGEESDTDVENTQLPQDGEIALIKTGVWDDSNGDGAANAGETITYTFAITNTGNVTITNIEIDDATLGITDLACVSSLAPGESGSCTATYTVTQADINAGNVTNTATATGTDPSGNDVNDDSSSDPNLPGEPTVTTLPGDPAIELAKTGTFNDENSDGFAQVGETITYNFTVTNTGNEPVTGITVSDDKITVTGPASIDLAVGESSTAFSGTYTLTQDDINNGSVTNQATAAGTDSNGNPVTDDASDNPATPEPDDPTIVDIIAPAILDIDKVGVWVDANQDGIPQVGEEIEYSFTITNKGGVTVTDINVTDLLPGVVVSGGPIDLQPGESDNTTFTAVYALTQTDINNAGVENTAVATGKDPNGNDVTEDDVENTSLGRVSEIEVFKSGVADDNDGDGMIEAGETFTYTITVQNTGNTTITNIDVTDPMLTVTCDVSTLEPGQSATCTGVYTLTQADVDAGEVQNQANATGNGPEGATVDEPSDDPDTPVEDDPTIIPIPAEGQISVEKVGVHKDENGDGFAQAGETIDYTFAVTNIGNVTVTNITLDDPLVTVSGGPIATLAVGATDTDTFTATYELTQADIDAGSFSNIATATGTDPNNDPVTDDSDDPNDPTNTDNNGDGEPDDPTVVDYVSKGSILVDKTGVWEDDNQDGIPQAGETMTYLFTVINNGDVTLTNVTITDILPGINISGGPIVSMAPGATDNTTFSATYALTQADVDAGIISNTATVTGTTPDGAEETDDDTEETALGQVPAIEVMKSGVADDNDGDGMIEAGETITYTITVENTGNVTVNNIVVTDNNADAGSISCDATELAPGASLTCTATHTITQDEVNAGKVENQADVTGEDPKGNPVDEPSDDPDTPEEDDPTVIDIPYVGSFEVQKIGVFNDENNDNLAQVGETIDYTFVVSNTGNVPLTAVSIDDQLITINGGPIDLAVGATDNSTFSGTYTLTQADLNSGEVENSATGTATDPNGDTLTDVSDDPDNPADVDTEGDGEPDDPTVVEFLGDADLALDKVGLFKDDNGDGIAQAGETITYTFKVTNTGNVTISNITIDDPLITVNGGPIPTLEPGDEDGTTFSGSYVITQADIDAGRVFNLATATGQDPAGNNVSDGDGTITTLGRRPAMEVFKSGVHNDADGSQQAEVGEVIDYTITVENTGNVTLTEIVITDDNADAGSISCGATTLEPGQSMTCTATHTITQEDLDAGRVENQALGSATTPTGTLEEPSDDPDTTPEDDPTIVPVFSNTTIAVNDFNVTPFETPVRGNVLTNDEDPEGDNQTVNTTPVSGPTNGSVTLNADGSYTYTPNAGFSGEDSFEYEVCDDGTPSVCDVATVVIEVLPVVDPVNNAPVANPDDYITDVNTPVNGSVLPNDFDPDGDDLTPTKTGDPTNGTVVFNPDGTFTYTPNTDFEGEDSFTYQVCDADGLCDETTVTIIVVPDNVFENTVVAVDDNGYGEMNTDITGNVLNNDTDPEGNNIVSVTKTSDPANGTVVVNNDGSYVYTPTTGYTGNDQFTYEICDDGSPVACDAATVYLTVDPVANTTIAVNDFNVTPFETPVSGNVLINDEDPEGDNQTVNTTPVSGPTNGSVTLNADGSYTYTPNAGFSGEDSFEYEVCDDGTPSVCDVATVVIEVLPVVDPVNNAPVANPDDYITDVNTPVNGSVLPNDFDPDGDDLTPTKTGDPTNGTVVFNPDGTFTYTPNTDFEGEDSFTYQVCDADGLCDETTVTIIVVPDNVFENTVVAVDDNGYGEMNTDITGNVLNNDTDPEGNNIVSVTKTSDPANGTVVVNNDGSYVYTPTTGYTGNDQFTYEICDDGSPVACDAATVYLTVDPVANTTIAVNDFNVTPFETPVSGNVLINDEDPEGDNQTVNTTPVSGPTNGSVTLNADGSYTYTPNAGFSGEDSFEYEVCDDGTPSVCDVATVVIEVLPVVDPVNNAPVANPDDYITDVNTPVNGSVLPNDFDPDGDDLTPTKTSDPTNGSVVFNPDGTFTYTPNTDFEGEDSFTYEVCDADGLCDETTVTIIVVPDNVFENTVVAVDDNGYGEINNDITGDVSLNDFDPEGNNIVSHTLISGPSNGSVVLNNDGTYVYTPNTDYTGNDSFIYEICDDGSPVACDRAAVILTIAEAKCGTIEVKVFLEGPFDETSGLMTSDLSINHLLPGQDHTLSPNGGYALFGSDTPPGQPYSVDPWLFTGTDGSQFGDENVNPGSSPYPSDVVDWVMISVRANGIQVSDELFRCVGWLKADGTVIFPEECTCQQFSPGTDYYIMVEHRNHLPILSAEPVDVVDGKLVYDFTTVNTYINLFGSGQKQVLPGVYTMYSGNGSQPGNDAYFISSLDYLIWETEQNKIGYMYGDFDLNGRVDSNDYLLWEENQNLSSDVPR